MLKNLVPPILSWYGASSIATRLELIADLGLATWFVQAEIVSDLERSLGITNNFQGTHMINAPLSVSLMHQDTR